MNKYYIVKKKCYYVLSGSESKKGEADNGGKRIEILLFLFFLNWGIIDLQCCASFRCTAK